MNKEQKKKLQERYDNLSLIDRDAYERIIERNSNYFSLYNLISSYLKIILVTGLFIIIFAMIFGIPTSTFSARYISGIYYVTTALFGVTVVGIISNIFEYIKINKLKEKLLSS